MNALHHYTTALRTVRPEDYSGHNMLLMLHIKRFFAGERLVGGSYVWLLLHYVLFRFYSLLKINIKNN